MSCTAIFAPLYQLFGAILKFFYDISNNYGIAIMLFTLAVNIILLPLTWKQQKSTTKMQAIQPELQKIQQKYKNEQIRKTFAILAIIILALYVICIISKSWYHKTLIEPSILLIPFFGSSLKVG